MSLGQLKRLPSVEGGRVGSSLPAKLAEVHESQPYEGAHWDSVRAAIRSGTIDPVHVDVTRGTTSYASPIMGDGLHWLAIAEDMGETSFPISNAKADETRHGRGQEWRLARHDCQREAG